MYFSNQNFDDGDVDVLELKKEINKRDSLISRLVAQSKCPLVVYSFAKDRFVGKEYNSDKERQEIELQAQRLTLQEQRNHIEILDTALMNAQNNIILLENEVSFHFFQVSRLSRNLIKTHLKFAPIRFGKNTSSKRERYFSRKL